MWKKAIPLTDEQKSLMQMLLDHARKIRDGYKYSEDEKMTPMAFIYGDSVTIMAMCWKDEKEKFLMAAAANAKARKEKAKTLSFVTDARWVEGKKFAAYYHLSIDQMGAEAFQKAYHRILNEHGGEVKNLPRELWSEAVIVFTNGPDFPLTVQMAPYQEGQNDTVEWLPAEDLEHDMFKSDLLTDWWS